MHIIESESIVLRTLKYGETSVIAEIFTRSSGLKSVIINGVRSSKNKSGASAFQVMNILNVSFYDKEADTLCRVKEYHYAVKYKKLGTDVIYTSVGIFLIECVRNAVKEKEENVALFDFLKKEFSKLDEIESGKLIDFYLRFLVTLTHLLGFAPYPDRTAQKPHFHLMHGRFVASYEDPAYIVEESVSSLLSEILTVGTSGSISGSKADKDKLTDELLRYFACHIEGFRPVRSLDVLRTIMR